jgi:hypothetical protein
MGYNTFETVDNSLRGEPYGQMTPEGQKLWDEYQTLLGGQKNAPMSTLRLRSGATMPIIEPGFGLKNRMLSKTLGGMNATGMGTRAAAQPGLFAQLAPLFIAAGIKDPATIKEILARFGGGAGKSPGDLSGFGGLSTSANSGGSFDTGDLSASDFGDVPVDSVDLGDIDWPGLY